MSKKINAMPYGFALISLQLFEELRSQQKIKTKKMLSYFDKNNDVFYNFISQGSFLPLNHLVNDRYSLYFSVDSSVKDISDEWLNLISWDSFYLSIDTSNSLWAIEFAEIESWTQKKYIDTDSINGVYYDINDNAHEDYKAIKYEIPKGQYNVRIIGLRKKELSEDDRENYGFHFILTSTNSVKEISDPTETNFHTLFELI